MTPHSCSTGAHLCPIVLIEGILTLATERFFVIFVQAQRIHERFKVIFPIDIPEQKARYELLCRAYIDARYQKDYSISQQDLAWLARRVEMLRDLVKVICEVRMGR